MLLSDVDIEARRATGAVVIEPFSRAQLNNCSYDLTLGPWVARYDSPRMFTARPVEDVSALFQIRDYSVPKGFVIKAGERLLGHTRERAGGTISRCGTHAVNASLHATSTAQRIGISCCLDAGWGDVGFTQKWTLEITNHSPLDIFLPVGAVICQIVFHDVTPPSELYDVHGQYDSEHEWVPEMMLPKRLKVIP